MILYRFPLQLSKELGTPAPGDDPRSQPRLLLQLVRPEYIDDRSNSRGPVVLEELAQRLARDFLADAGGQGLLGKLGRGLQQQQKREQQQRGQGGGGGQLLPSEKELVQALEDVMEQAVLLKLQLMATDAYMEVMVLGEPKGKLGGWGGGGSWGRREGGRGGGAGEGGLLAIEACMV